MRTITLERRYFVKNSGGDEFDWILEQLSIPNSEWEDIEQVHITVDEFETE